MDSQKLLQETEQIIQNDDIPNQPQVVLDLNKELNKPEPNFYKISDLVGNDIDLTIKVIRIANSPFWGIKREINSIHSALVILGIRNFKNLVLSSCLQKVLKNDVIPNEEFEIFYIHSLKTAGVSSFLAENLSFQDNKKVDKDHAYLLGLLHDCGIMIMAKKYQGYYDDMVSSLIIGNDPSVIELTHYQTNHCKVGGLLAKKWNVPHSLIEPILFHHNYKFEITANIQNTKLLAILRLAEHIISTQPSIGILDLLYNNKICSKDSFFELLSFVNLDLKAFSSLVSITSELTPVS
jgi:HD-like signal output (HDOD) protein